ncbi:MAG: aminotransferase class V-fold PLP-dependent enzyme [Treponema sp.]|nr:aminotransferase class V-fold PLP-dependent enzyme [Treponema sp.]
MKTFPLPALNLEEAVKRQFALVDAVTRHFKGAEFLAGGDRGLAAGLGRPAATQKTEEVLADFFEQQDAVLVRGAGTGSIRSALAAAFNCGDSILVHNAPVYPTTKASMQMMGLKTTETDFNDIPKAAFDYKDSPASGALVQLARQKPGDSCDYTRLIPALKKISAQKPIITDDNYAVMRVPKIGCQAGADLSCFSLFKLLGPEGIGCVVGKHDLIQKIRAAHYSGGVQVQGPEAMEALRSLVYTPVALAIQAQVCEETVRRLCGGEVKGVKDAFVVNAQSRVIIAELADDNAAAVIEKAAIFGAAPYPVGAESRYEITPLFYRVSGTFLENDPGLASRMIRINPMRAGADTIISILRKALDK